MKFIKYICIYLASIALTIPLHSNKDTIVKQCESYQTHAAGAVQNSNSNISEHSGTSKDYASFMEAYYKQLQLNFGINIFGTCGYIASSMLLTYYDTFLNDNIVPETYEASSLNDSSNFMTGNESPGSIMLELELDEDETDKDKEDMPITESAKTYYYNFIDENKYLSLHAKLVSIGKEKYNIYDFDDNESAGAATLAEIQAVTQTFLEDVSKLKRSQDFWFKTETGGAEAVKAFTKQQIDEGCPVFLFLQSSHKQIGHFVIAYAYDDNDIYCHFGWHDFPTYTSPKLSDYSIYSAAFSLHMYLEHVHSNNYGVKTSSGDYDYYCPCQTDKICTYKHNWKFDKSTNAFFSECLTCGLEDDTIIHSTNGGFEKYDATYHKTLCSDCGGYMLQRHTFRPDFILTSLQHNLEDSIEPQLISPGERVRCSYCNYSTTVNDKPIPVLPPRE